MVHHNLMITRSLHPLPLDRYLMGADQWTWILSYHGAPPTGITSEVRIWIGSLKDNVDKASLISKNMVAHCAQHIKQFRAV